MSEIEQQIEELTRQLQDLKTLQTNLNGQLQLVEKKLQSVRSAVSAKVEIGAVPEPQPISARTQLEQHADSKLKVKQAPRPKRRLQINNELEDFIGTNVISKIGILVTVIGVFIGAKYAIDKELISPATRILMGYLSAAALVMVALRLKQQYKYFSSILMGGGLAVIYFITYIAYSFYSLYPPVPTFIVMVATTIAAVVISLWYDQKVIASLGQVAAYAIPFLLSNGSGNVFILFGYITVINLGLLILSFYKDWKSLYHIAFFLTWLVYITLIVVGEKVTNVYAGMGYLAVTFFTFYATFLSYKIFKRQLFLVSEIAVLLLNTLLFFFIGAFLIADHFHNIHFLTGFTVFNAGLHLAAGLAVYKLRLADHSVFQFILGFGLLFITIAIPIELDANWVTLLWIIEASILSYVASRSKRLLYLEIAIPLIIISVLSLLQDWDQQYPFIGGQATTGDYRRIAFLNTNFTLSVLFCFCLGMINFYAKNIVFNNRGFVRSFYTPLLPLAFLLILYFALFNEIHFAWDKQFFYRSDVRVIDNRDISLIIFSCFYFAGWLFFNRHILKSENLHRAIMLFAAVSNFVFLYSGLNASGGLRQYYMQHNEEPFTALLLVRYVSIFALALMWLGIDSASSFFSSSELRRRRTSIVFNITLLSIISNEFIHWMDIAGYQNQYKLGLSLIFGMYALVLLFVGMRKRKKHLRMSAIILFGATLMKLFFYDLASLSAISKTVVLVLLGILLLSASFLYNKYKVLLFRNDETVV